MFKNRAIQVSMVKKDNQKDSNENPGVTTHLDAEWLDEAIKEQVKHTSYAIVGVYAAVKALSTASQILINIAPKR